ncbi:cytochrome P450 [Irpex rosettiformis]|uniref:Cytochrome P450 n=1 Tax=Irpex rosettiformis TaxID=378272 RepID=A0ACB8U2W7_9APHY|nr:cytochrome P450 [Irpex rosettiformis]
MKYLPTWLAKWKREGLAWHERETRMFEGFNTEIAEKMNQGEAPESFVTDLIQTENRHKLSKKESAWLAGNMVSAGSETTSSTLENFILIMIHHPEVMRKAQAEIDSVVGRERPPLLQDRSYLPYIGAVMKELLRWRPAAPIGLPRRATEDNWYEGHFIPKGTTVIGNIWDPSIFPDFDTYRPERWLDAAGKLKPAPPDTHQMGHLSFGFGRRNCPGMYFADQALFIAELLANKE